MSDAFSPRALPVYEGERNILEALRDVPRLVIVAPTGSGKSTQVPQMLLDHGLLGAAGQAVVLQPRRLAARMLARRVAAERGSLPGQEVGYRVRFERCLSSATRLLYETDGILLRRMVDDPSLPEVKAVIFDEFHERHLYGDLALGLCLQAQQRVRPDLLLVVMSATLDTRALERFLQPCRVVSVEGRAFPVDIEYLPRPVRFDRTPPWEAARRAFEDSLRRFGRGNTLIFMPGGYEIRRTVDCIGRLRSASGYVVLPLYGELPPARQDDAVAEHPQPTAVVGTNVAETSLTIPGITVVIDSGLARKARFDPHRGINTLLVERICRASADQRAGRAGRTQR
jgi:ATP-dependent helicase HrpB